MRAPEEAASWEWELDAFAPPGLDSALATAVRMSEVLREHGLLRPDSLRWRWFVKGRGSVATTELAMPESPTEEELSRGIAESRPVAHPNAEVGALRMSGTGSWFDAEGAERRERDLVVLTVYLAGDARSDRRQGTRPHRSALNGGDRRRGALRACTFGCGSPRKSQYPQMSWNTATSAARCRSSVRATACGVVGVRVVDTPWRSGNRVIR
jgi:hypothetical protein